jgi:hypothetical protein
MPNTKIDIGTVNNCRKTFPIPSSTMIIMSGKCLHGGSSYSSCNARLHFEFIPYNQGNVTHSIVQDLIATTYQCPLDTYPCHKKGHSFDTKAKLYYHWQKELMKKGSVKLSLKSSPMPRMGGLFLHAALVERDTKPKSCCQGICVFVHSVY